MRQNTDPTIVDHLYKFHGYYITHNWVNPETGKIGYMAIKGESVLTSHILSKLADQISSKLHYDIDPEWYTIPL